MNLPSFTPRAAAITVLALSLVSLASAQSVPFTNNFDGTGANVDFSNEIVPGGSVWSLNGGTYRNTFTTTSALTSSAVTRVTGVANSSFTLSTQFTISSVAAYGSGNQTFDVSIGAFGNDVASTLGVATGTGANILAADWVAASGTTATALGELRLRSFIGTTATTLTTAPANKVDDNAGSTILAATLNTTYTLKLTALYTGTSNTYNLSFGLYDSAGTTQLGASSFASNFVATAEPTNGYFFGLRTRTAAFSPSSTYTTNFDNFSITAIPEPSSFAALGGLVALGTAFCNRRRRVAAR